ncbi:MAG TPA: hypothetical protein VJL81_05830 [Solirubrobacterales bacterium]|nr:hypothetical protein [Solirubrobacterales bacterium]
MAARKLALPALIALACLGAGLFALPAAAGTKPASTQAGKGVAKLKVDAVEVGTKAGPLIVRVAAPYLYEISMTVNGKRVRHPFTRVGKRAQQIELRSSDGLRPGANKLRIQAWHGGVQALATRTVEVPAWALLANAGEDIDTPLHINGKLGTPPALGGARDAGDVRYSWQVVKRPRGPKPQLLGRDKARPTLRAKQPGSYVLQLEAEPEEGGEPASFDQVTVAVVPSDPPIGVPIGTLNSSGSIMIAGQYYGENDDGIAYVVLERATRAVVTSGSVSTDGNGIGALSAIADKYSAEAKYLMIVSGRSKIPNDQLAAFADVLRKLGSPLLTKEDFAAFESGQQYSAIGTLGSSPGAATTRIPGVSDNPALGAIDGYLQRNQPIEGTPAYEYVSPERPSFDTVAAGSDATTSVIKVGGDVYKNALPAGTTAGFHVLVLESLTLGRLSDQVLATNGTANDRAAQAAAGNALARSIEKPGGPLVFVQTIGKPKAAGPEWEKIVAPLRRLGGDALAVNALDGTAEYALVGRLGAAAPPAESSTAYDHGPYGVPDTPPAHLIGALSRSRTSNFVPTVFSTPTAENPGGSVNLALMALAYQPKRAWPDLAPSATRAEAAAAAKYVCGLAKLCIQPTECATLRDCFTQDYSSVNWDIVYTAISSAKSVATPDFNQATFEAVQKELGDETADVARVRSYLSGLVEPLEKKTVDSYVDLQGIGNKIWESVQRPAADDSESWTLNLISKIVAIGSFAPPPASNAARGLSAAFGLVAYLSTPKGQPILGSEIKIEDRGPRPGTAQTG